MSQNPAYKRVMLKVSGEALMGDRDYGLDNATCRHIAEDIRGVVDLGVQVCLVIGGGNIFRGISGAASGMDRAQADSIGMLATVMNALAMRDALAAVQIPFIEVHLSNVFAREAFRHHSYFTDIAVGIISGLGAQGYELALAHALRHTPPRR